MGIMKEFFNKNKILLISMLLFVASVTFWYAYGNYPKMLTTYKDELIYYSMAQNFAQGRGLVTIYGGLPYNTSRYLYSILISPTFLFTDRIQQFKALSLINSITICSGIFPTALLAKKVLKKDSHIILVLFLYALSVDMGYSLVIMSDVLFYPICIWFFYFVYCYLDDHKVRYLIYILFISIMGLFTKRAMLVMMGSFAFIFFIDLLCEKNSLIKKKYFLLLIMLFVTIGVFLAYKLGFNRVIIAYFKKYISYLSENKFSFIKVNVYYVMHLVLGMIALPLLLPYVYFDKLSKSDKKFLGLLTLVLLCYAFVNYVHVLGPMDDARVSYRYIMFLVPLFNILFFKTFESTENANYNYIRWGIILLVGVAMFMFYQGVFRGSLVDYFSLGYVHFIQNVSVKLLKCICLGFIVISTLLFFWEKKACIGFFVVAYIVAQVASLMTHVEFTKMYYSVSETTLEAINISEEFVKEHMDNTILILHEYKDDMNVGEYISSVPNRLADTFLNYENTLHTSIDRLVESEFENGKGIDLNESKIIVAFYMTSVKGVSYQNTKIDYIMVSSYSEPYIDENLCEKVELNDLLFKVYKLKDPSILPIKKLD